MTKVLLIGAKTLKEAFRQPKNLAITLGLPVVFMLIFGLAFGGSEETAYKVAVVDHDDSDLSRAYAGGLAGMTYASGAPLLRVANATDEAAARAGIGTNEHDLVVIIPEGFEADATPQGAPPQEGPVPLTQPQGPAPAEGAVVLLIGDPSRVPFQASQQIVASYTAEFSKQVSRMDPAVGTRVESVTAPELTTFDLIAPGLMVFAILNIIPGAAGALARESETRTLDRVRMSPTRGLTLLAGVALGQILIASVSLALMLLTASLMGFHNQGSYAAAYAIAIGAAVAATGIGLVVAALARTQQEAASFGALVSVPLSFLSGAFFAIPGVRLVGDVELYDLIPTTHAVQAMRRVMTLGEPLADVGALLLALGALGALYFAAGVVIYRRTRLAAE